MSNTVNFESADGVIKQRSLGASGKTDPMYNHGWTHYFESMNGWQQGMLCFDGKEVVDYDGCFELPLWVVKALLERGFYGEFTLDLDGRVSE